MAPTLGTAVSSLPPEGAQAGLGRPGAGLISCQVPFATGAYCSAAPSL